MQNGALSLVQSGAPARQTPSALHVSPPLQSKPSSHSPSTRHCTQV